ncbi:hypothetical protein SAMN04488074_101875 [Lentzea albidocapillata subsp. violacea]|uniref:Uncharacterized protein n=1 Tax=Lentzea albidocapillata subsp. violacea TaxID=128104 RepID=A0A1G8S530_9PSEU|nr:hypothetical protein [Lentzea albidocapillata]SDJ24252.1 hypothetical protein SAMN04488074_101875 [Lentzea albidocapillata subsp. violacea]
MLHYLEPRTDVAAKDDWSTGLILQDLRWGARTLGGIAVVAGAGAVTCWLLPSTPGSIGAFVVLALITLVGGLGPLMYRSETKAQRRGLLEGPWRRVPAGVLEKHADGTDRLLVEGIVLKGWFEDLPDMVLERQEVFVCGPDAGGRAVLRAAGFAKMENAKVDHGEGAAKHPVRKRVERPLGRPLDDAATLRAFKGMRWGMRAWLWSAVPAVAGGVLVLLSLFPFAPAGLVVGGLLLVSGLLGIPTSVEISRWYRDAVLAVENSAQWTPVAITLFPWQPNQHVAGLAEMPGGLALVQFVLPDLSVVANIADTGVMWIAGTHGDVIAVGVPRVPVLTFAAVQPDRDTPKEDPIPPILRFHQPDFSGLPR